MTAQTLTSSGSDDMILGFTAGAERGDDDLILFLLHRQRLDLDGEVHMPVG